MTTKKLTVLEYYALSPRDKILYKLEDGCMSLTEIYRLLNKDITKKKLHAILIELEKAEKIYTVKVDSYNTYKPTTMVYLKEYSNEKVSVV